MQKKQLSLALLAGVALSGAAQATLIDRGGGMIYDNYSNITWLADANYAKTQYTKSNGALGDLDGLFTWAAANTWAANLSYGGYDDWRLASLNASDTTCGSINNPGGGFPLQYYGYGCTGGELSHLLVTDLGNKPNESVLNQVGDTPEQIANLSLFSNVQSYMYWSGLVYAPNTNGAWSFQTSIGYQRAVTNDSTFYAWAVRPGDVAAANNVPEPATLMLLGLGLAGLGAMRRRG